MSDLIIIGYPDETTAQKVWEELVRLERDYLVDLDDAAIIRRDRKGKLHQDCGVETPAFRPGRKRRFTSQECRWWSLVCSHVPVPSDSVGRPGGAAAGPLRPRPVRVEPRGRAARALASGPDERPGLPGAVPAAHRRPRRE